MPGRLGENSPSRAAHMQRSRVPHPRAAAPKEDQMNVRPLLLPLILSTLIATPVLASFGSKPDTPAPSSSNSSPEASDQKTPRQQAEAFYNDAYNAEPAGFLVAQARQLQEVAGSVRGVPEDPARLRAGARVLRRGAARERRRRRRPGAARASQGAEGGRPGEAARGRDRGRAGQGWEGYGQRPVAAAHRNSKAAGTPSFRRPSSRAAVQWTMETGRVSRTLPAWSRMK